MAKKGTSRKKYYIPSPTKGRTTIAMKGYSVRARQRHRRKRRGEYYTGKGGW